MICLCTYGHSACALPSVSRLRLQKYGFFQYNPRKKPFPTNPKNASCYQSAACVNYISYYHWGQAPLIDISIVYRVSIFQLMVLPFHSLRFPLLCSVPSIYIYSYHTYSISPQMPPQSSSVPHPSKASSFFPVPT